MLIKLKNKKGDFAVTLVVILSLALVGIALFSFNTSNRVFTSTINNPNILDEVYLQKDTGEFYLPVTDVTLPGENLKLQFTRIYRSQSNFLGSLGFNWTHNFAERLLFWDSPDGSGYTYVDNAGKKYFFHQTEEGFESPVGLFLTLKEIDSGFVLEDWEGGARYFSKVGLLTKIRNAAGEEQTLVYNDEDILNRVEDSKHRTLQFFYQPDGLLERVEDFTGRIWKFEYNKEHELIATTSPGTPDFPKGKTTHYHYNKHRLILMMDPKGQIFLQNFYGESGENFGKVMMQKYGNETASIEARYDGLNAWIKDRRGIMYLYEHDEEGHLLRRKLVKEDGTQKTLRQFEYNKAGLCTAEIFPSGLKIEYRWEGPKLVKKIMVAKDGTKLVLNIFSSEESSTISEKTEPLYEYDLWGNIISVTAPEGEIRKLDVNASNLVTKEIVKGENRFYRYDANDNIIEMKIPDRKLEVSFEYDVLDRLTIKKEILDDDHAITTRYEHDPEGHLTRFIYPMGNEDRFIYNDEGRLIQKIRGFGTLEQTVEKYEYDEDGNLIAVIDGEGNKTIYFYDPFGRNTGFRTPMGNETQYTLNEAGYVVVKEEKDAEGKLLAKEKWEYKDNKIAKFFRYLFRDNPKKGTWVEMSPSPSPSRGEGMGEGDYPIVLYDPLNRPTQIEKTKFKWDDNGRLTSITAENGETTMYAYDARNRLSLEHYPNNTEVRYAYDNADRVVGKTDKSGNNLRFEYDKESRVVSRHANQFVQNFVYDGLGRLLSATDFNTPSDTSDDVKTQFHYDSFSREIGESLDGRWVYKSYDKDGNKASVDYPSKLQIVRQFDADGNMKSVFLGAKEIAQQNVVEQRFGLEDAAGQQTLTRNLSGFLIQNNHFLYRYDDWGRLIAVENQNQEPVMRYTYDVFGRVARENDKKFSYDDWENIETFLGNQPAQSIIYGDHLDTPLSLKNYSKAPEEIYFYHQDKFGSVRFLTNEEGKTVERYDYSPYGVMQIQDADGKILEHSQIGNPLGFIGRPFDYQTGLVNLRMRYYAPALQQFISPDPLGYKNEFFAAGSIFTPRNFSYHQGQGEASRTTTPNYVKENGETKLLDVDLFFTAPPEIPPVPEMNLYVYANNDPLNFYDPFGLYFIDVELPYYGQRQNYGLLRLYNDEDKLVTGPFRVLGRSSNSWFEKGKKVFNKNKTRNPLYKYGDTPPGIYLIDKIEKDADRAKFGPNEVIKMDPLMGDARTAERNGREGLWIHGGRAKPKYSFGDGLASTQGCVRMHDKDMAALIEQINLLKKEGDDEGLVVVSEKSLTNIKQGGKK